MSPIHESPRKVAEQPKVVTEVPHEVSKAELNALENADFIEKRRRYAAMENAEDSAQRARVEASQRAFEQDTRPKLGRSYEGVEITPSIVLPPAPVKATDVLPALPRQYTQADIDAAPKPIVLPSHPAPKKGGWPERYDSDIER